VVLQLGQLSSNIGTQSAVIVYPLLVLAVTGSAPKAGIVVFARTLPLGSPGTARRAGGRSREPQAADFWANAAVALRGALFGIARALPFAFDAVSYAFSTVSLLAMRTPFQEARKPASRRRHRAPTAGGLHSFAC
jgi:hypothetical protein